MASGTDEHGTPITYEADEQGVPPREFADRNNALIVEDLRRLGMTYDIFTRTTTANHYRVTQQLFLTLYEKGYLVKEKQMGAFDPASGRTLKVNARSVVSPTRGATSATTAATSSTRSI